jgi:hypothetical protein
MWLALGFQSSGNAQDPFPDPNTCPAAECGLVSPLIPMESAEAVHMGLVWKKESQNPKILFHARFPEYTPNDIADPEVVDRAIELGAFTTPGPQFNSSLRDVLHGFDAFLELGTERSPDDSFQRLTYGGYLLRQGLTTALVCPLSSNAPDFSHLPEYGVNGLWAKAKSADNAASIKEETQVILVNNVVFILQSPFKIAAATPMVAIHGSFLHPKSQGVLPSRARKEAEKGPWRHSCEPLKHHG